MATKEKALTWIKVYIAERSRCSFSGATGSVLGPKNYCMYTKLVGKITKRHNIKYCFAEDMQVYVSYKAKCWMGYSSSIEACTEDKYLDEQQHDEIE